MKILKCLMLTTLIFPVLLFAQGQDYKVIFDLSSRDTINQQTIIRELQLIRASSPDAKMEVMMYGHGIDLVIRNRSKFSHELQSLIADKNISFKVCAMTLKRNNLNESDLMSGVEAVPDGIYEIFKKQREGWGYIKVGH